MGRYEETGERLKLLGELLMYFSLLIHDTRSQLFWVG
jgi:hypothetical protein